MASKAKDIDLGRLCNAMQNARKGLQRFRENRREAVRAFAGNNWSEDGAQERTFVNLLALYISIVSRNLIAQNPRVMLSTFDKTQKPMVTAMESWANKEIEAIQLANTLQRIVVDALFSVGICKVALATPADTAKTSWSQEAGQPFVERVDLDDFLFDVHARDFKEAGFVAHRIRVPLEVVKGSDIYNKAVSKKLEPSVDSPYNIDGDEKINTMGRGAYNSNSEEFEDFVDLWEVYLPRHKLILTLADKDAQGAEPEVLREQEWLGPDCGPYHFLSYTLVPGNAMPKGPIQDLKDLHDLVNNLYRKLARQAERQKEVLPVRSGATEDGSRIIETADGEAFRCDNESPKAVRFGGPSQENFVFAQHGKDLFSWLGGNLDIMGGLSPQSKTATQDTMLDKNSTKSIGDMQDRTVTFTASVLKGLLWYWYHDPYKTMKTNHSIPGLPDITLQRKVAPEQRAWDKFADLDLKVDPYSMQHSSPQMRAQGLNQLVQQVIVPMMPILQQQGVSFDINAYLAKMALYMDMPDLGDMLTIREPPQQEQAGPPSPDGQQMPQNTTRTYERRSLGGESRQAKDAAMTALMQGGSEKAAQTQGTMQGM